MDYGHQDTRGSMSGAAEGWQRYSLSEWSPRGMDESGKWDEVDLQDLHISEDILERVPESVARENRVFPLDFDGETLTLAALDADDIALADKLRFLLNANINLIEKPNSQLRRAIRDHYQGVHAESADSCLQEFHDTEIDFCEASDRDDDLLCQPEVPQCHKGRKSKLAYGYRSRVNGDVAYASRAYCLQPGKGGMFHITIDEGERYLRTRLNGSKEVIVGPARVWKGWSHFEEMPHFVAHPGEFLMIRFRDGTQQHVPGPAETWFDERVHQGIEIEECLQLAAKEAVVVYCRPETHVPGEGDAATANVETRITRRIEYGPQLFTPQPGEWLHRFSWHASKGGHQGAQKVPNALKFQKLWLMPDQMYHDVRDVRTADNAVLVIKLMIFFELVDIDRMLDTTHDPIGDFVNAATADVIEFTGRHDFEAFKQNTDRLNELETYRTLLRRAEQIGYRVNNVVYRGYGAAESLQKMHDQAIEARTRLQLDRATEEQTQDLENYRLESQLARAAKRRGEQASEVRHELELERERQQADLTNQQARQAIAREQLEADAQVREAIESRKLAQQREHLQSLGGLGVNLTDYLTQGRADQVIELRGGKGSAPHVHLGRQLAPAKNGS